MKYDYSNVIVRKRSDIPHWHVPNGIYFVTWRLADSLPRHVEARLAEMRAALRTARQHDYHGSDARGIEREIFTFTEAEFDRHHGACWIRNPEIASLIVSSFEFADGRDYDLIAFTLMPNHIHVVFRLTAGELDQVIKRWKSYTAHRANELLQRSGNFWQPDYFDVLIRDSTQLQRTVAYVLGNPAKAGLHDWPWIRTWPDRVMGLI